MCLATSQVVIGGEDRRRPVRYPNTTQRLAGICEAQ